MYACKMFEWYAEEILEGDRRLLLGLGYFIELLAEEAGIFVLNILAIF